MYRVFLGRLSVLFLDIFVVSLASGKIKLDPECGENNPELWSGRVPIEEIPEILESGACVREEILSWGQAGSL